MGHFDEVSRQLLQIKHDMERTEAKVEHAHDLIREVGNTGLLTRRALLGPHYTQRWEPGRGPQDSEQVVQAALFVPEGFGVCYRDANEFWELEQSPEGLESNARSKFEPFENCSAAEKKFLYPFIGQMLDELADVALVAASKLEPEPRVRADDYFARRANEADGKPAK